MAQLPADRTKLNAAVANQQPSIVASAQANREALIEAYDTIDMLYNFTAGLVAGGTLQPYPHGLYRNAIINGNFDIWQRGKAFFNPPTPTYTADRFFVSASADGGVFPSVAHFCTQMGSGELVGSRYCYSINFDGPGSNFGPNASYGIFQRIEHGARYMCGNGRKVTVSFYAYSNIPGKRIGVNLKQKYGSGGSPSPDDILRGSVITLTNVWTRYSVTFDTVSLAGKTFGTQENDNLQLGFYIMWGSNIAGELVAGGTSPEDFRGNGFVNIAQVQLNVGDVALPFQPRSFAEELALCQRYYYSTLNYGAPSGVPGTASGVAIHTSLVQTNTKFPVMMRTKPTFGIISNGNPNQMRNIATNSYVTLTSPIISGNENGTAYVEVSNTPFTVGDGYDFDITADAEL